MHSCWIYDTRMRVSEISHYTWREALSLFLNVVACKTLSYFHGLSLKQYGM